MIAGEEAAALEAALGISVLRHTQKKPAGDCIELEQRFGWVAGHVQAGLGGGAAAAAVCLTACVRGGTCRTLMP